MVFCLVMIDTGKKSSQWKQFKVRYTKCLVEMILDFDLLYPFLRKRFYVAWITDGKDKSSKFCRSQCLPCFKNKQMKGALNFGEGERDIEDEVRIFQQNMNEKIEHLQQHVNCKIADLQKDVENLQKNVNNMVMLLKNIKESTDKIKTD